MAEGKRVNERGDHAPTMTVLSLSCLLSSFAGILNVGMERMDRSVVGQGWLLEKNRRRESAELEEWRGRGPTS